MFSPTNGSPSGKSYFLWLVWNLRIAANLPTILINAYPSALFWINGQAYKVDDMNERASRSFYFPERTWCLIDSDDELDGLPRVSVSWGCFILKVASPDTVGYWMQKNSSELIGMKDWEYGELVAGLVCFLH